MNKKLFYAVAILFLVMGSLNAQERTLSGKITDIMGNAIPAVTVSIKDYASLMTISGADGEFRIDVFDFSKALVFTFAGMKTIEVPINDTIDRISVQMVYLPLKNPNPWNIGLFFGLLNTEIYNKVIENDKSWDLQSDMGMTVELEMDYFLTQNIGIGAGLGYSIYESSMYLNNFNNYGENYLTRIDKDGEQYYLYNEVNEAIEKIQLHSLDLPIKVKLRYRQDKKLGFFLDLGIRLMYIIKAEMKGNISAEWQGYYPQYHVVLHSLPEYGFVQYETDISQVWENYEPLNISAVGSFGISYRINQKLHADFGIYADYGLSDLKYEQAKHPADYLNTIGITDKTSTRSFGANLGIRYHINKK